MHYEAFIQKHEVSSFSQSRKQLIKIFIRIQPHPLSKWLLSPNAPLLPSNMALWTIQITGNGARAFLQDRAFLLQQSSLLQIIKKHLRTSETLYSMDKEISLSPAGATHFRPEIWAYPLSCLTTCSPSNTRCAFIYWLHVFQTSAILLLLASFFAKLTAKPLHVVVGPSQPSNMFFFSTPCNCCWEH